jgi:hypothetical protein
MWNNLPIVSCCGFHLRNPSVGGLSTLHSLEQFPLPSQDFIRKVGYPVVGPRLREDSL